MIFEWPSNWLFNFTNLTKLQLCKLSEETDPDIFPNSPTMNPISLFITILVALSLFQFSLSRSHKENLNKSWKHWKKQFNKTYPSDIEEEWRKIVWETNFFKVCPILYKLIIYFLEINYRFILFAINTSLSPFSRVAGRNDCWAKYNFF